MMNVRLGTARTVMVGPVLDADGVAKTNLAVAAILASKNGGNPAALDGSATLTHKQTGHYLLLLTANDISALGCLEMSIDSTTDAMPIARLNVLTVAAWDALHAASGGYLPAYINGYIGTALTESSAGYVSAGVKKFFDKATPTGTINSLADAVPGAAGGGFIAGSNAATSVTTALTANITGNLSGSVGSVSAAVVTDSASRTASKATGFSTHAAADVYTAFGTGGNLTTCATATGFNTTVPDAAGVVATALGNLETHGDSTWATAAGFSTHSAANVVTAIGTGATLTACITATGFSTHSAANVYTAFGTGGNLTTCATATGFSTHAAADVYTAFGTGGNLTTCATATSVTVSDKTGFSLANGAITAAVIAADAIDADSLKADAANEIADAILVRAVSNVEDSADKHSLGAVVMIATNASATTTTLTAKKPSDDTTFQTYTLTVDADANPVTGVS